MRLRCHIFLFLIAVLSSCQWLPEVGKVSLSESSVTLKVGGSRQLSATVEPLAAEYEGISWISSDPSVASITNGTVVAKKVGTAQITASAAGISSNPCQVTVDATHVTGVSLSDYSVEITEGESITISATVSPSDATDPSFSWGSDNTSVASVQNGKIVAIAPGTATISVKTSDGNKTATCKVTVKSKVIDVTSITLSQSRISVKEEATLQLKVTVKPSNATNQEVTWSSGDKGIATVSSDGTVKGVTEGSTTITAKSANGKVTASCKVTVTAEYVYIPDANFRQYILDNFDRNRNGKLSLTEAAMIKRIVVNTDNINSLQGIEYMPALSYLKCDGSSFNSSSGSSGRLTKLDVSQNTELQTLWCQANQLTSLDVSKNTALTRLLCDCNQLTSLDVSRNTALTYLNCGSNHLTSLDVSKNTALTYLGCGSNQLTSLDVSKNTALTYLYCYSNQLTSLDVSKNTALTELSCPTNQLTSLDVSKNTALTLLGCASNELTILDISKNTSLASLNCCLNQLTSLDVSKNYSLTWLRCNPMNNNSLKYLYVAADHNINTTSFDIPSYTQIIRR